jgi:hypothetical protein
MVSRMKKKQVNAFADDSFFDVDLNALAEPATVLTMQKRAAFKLGTDIPSPLGLSIVQRCFTFGCGGSYTATFTIKQQKKL